FLAFLQLTASLLNFLPIPGVDGGNILYPWLTPQWKRGFGYVAPWGMLILFGLLFSPRINAVFFDLVDTVGDFFGLPSFLADQASTCSASGPRRAGVASTTPAFFATGALPGSASGPGRFARSGQLPRRSLSEGRRRASRRPP